MGYIRRTWRNGEEITDAKLNNIEEGIAEAKKAAEQNQIAAGKAQEGVDALNVAMPQRDRVANLLDNSDFRNPVMQAGFNGKHGNDVYIIDRWLHLYNSGTVSLVPDGIKLSGYNVYMHQRTDITPYAGKTLTFAVHISDGRTVCGTIAADDIISNTGYVVISQDEGLILQAHNGGLSIRLGNDAAEHILQWAALYEGEYTADTLPAYQPKGFAAELAECQRYYENSWWPNDKSTRNMMLGGAGVGNRCDTIIWFKAAKRITPTITLHPAQGKASWQYYNAGSYFDAPTTEILMRESNNGFLARQHQSESDTTGIYARDAYYTEGHWEASADL